MPRGVFRRRRDARRITRRTAQRRARGKDQGVAVPRERPPDQAAVARALERERRLRGRLVHRLVENRHHRTRPCDIRRTPSRRSRSDDRLGRGRVNGDVARRRGDPVGHHLKSARPGFDPGWEREGRARRSAGRDRPRRFVCRSGVEDVSRRGVGDLDDREVGGGLSIVTVVGALVEAAQLRSRNGVRGAGVLSSWDGGDRRRPARLRSAGVRIDVHAVFVVDHHLAGREHQHPMLVRAQVRGVRRVSDLREGRAVVDEEVRGARVDAAGGDQHLAVWQHRTRRIRRHVLGAADGRRGRAARPRRGRRVVGVVGPGGAKRKDLAGGRQGRLADLILVRTVVGAAHEQVWRVAQSAPCACGRAVAL